MRLATKRTGHGERCACVSADSLGGDGLALILSVEELRALTGRIQSDAQARELDLIGIPYKRRSNKSLVVMRIAVESVLNNGNVRMQSYEPMLHLS